MPKEFYLNGFGLHDGAFRITDTDVFSMAPKVNKLIELARSDGGVQVMEKFAAKPISLTGTINADSSSELEAYIDQLKTYVGQKNMRLEVGYRNGYRLWTVNVENCSIARSATEVSRCGFSLALRAPKPYAVDYDSDVFVGETGRTAAFSVGVDAGGTYLVFPVFEITINSINPDDSETTITIGNPAEDRFINVTDIFQAGDVITVDSVYKQVYKNDTLLRPTGNFPVWLPGAGTFEYSDTATTRNIDISANYDYRWL